MPTVGVLREREALEAVRELEVPKRPGGSDQASARQCRALFNAPTETPKARIRSIRSFPARGVISSEIIRGKQGNLTIQELKDEKSNTLSINHNCIRPGHGHRL